jgi:hypothetical protein
MDVHSIVLLILSNRGALDTIRIKAHAIIKSGIVVIMITSVAEIAEDSDHGLDIARTERQEVGVLRTPERLGSPHREEHGPFENESVAVGRLRQAIE